MSALENEPFDHPPPPRGTSDRRPAITAKVPPNDLDAEASLLGAMLLSRDAIAVAADTGIHGGDFYKPAYGHVFDAVMALYSRGEPVDAVTVADVLRRGELLDAIGGPALLVTLQAGTPSTTAATRYAKIIEELALLRRLISVAGEISEEAFSAGSDVAGTIDRAESLVYEVAQRRVTDSVAPIESLLHENLNRLEALADRTESITGVPTGFTDLDELLAGLQPSNLVVVGARPAMGKCVAYSARILDQYTGEYRTIQEIYELGVRGVEVPMWGLDSWGALQKVEPSAFIDDGRKPTFTVRTRLGREVTVTASHPFLTARGWKPLFDLGVGTRIAVPRTLPTFGHDELPDAEVKLLGYLIGDGGLTTTTPTFTTACPIIEREVGECAAHFGVALREHSQRGAARSWRLSGSPGNGPNPLTARLREHELMGLGSHDKFVPRAVFRLPKPQVALFLSRLFATDGSAWWTDAGDGYGRISYCTVSKRLAHDVQHLLLRFGLNARIREKRVKYLDGRNTAYELELMAAEEISAFAAEIGIFSKEAQVEYLVARLEMKRRGRYTRDSVPVEIWDQILAAKGGTSWREINRLAGKPVSHNWHVGSRSPRRETVAVLADVLDDSALHAWGHCDIYWDEIVAIDDAGIQQVYDLTIPDVHNFIADDVCVHNTAFALGLASHAAVEARRPVLIFSLEMGQLEVSQRILCAEARVDSTKVRNGRLGTDDWSKISNAVGRIADAPIYIDENPNINVMDIRAKARRLRSQLGDLGVVIIDYVQLMSGRSGAESRQVEVSEISRSLKILARELETPVVALAQLNRALEQRADKRPMLSDLRESGSLEQDADVVMFLYRDEVYDPESQDRGTAEVIVSKHRNGPVGKVRLAWLDRYTKFANMARGV
jgi:replicative DNA helicase